MHVKPNLIQPRALAITVAAALSAFFAVGMLTAVVWLFQREGMPFEQLVAAERACVSHKFVSARESCMREWQAAARSRQLAGK